jgi:GT2 family glycosyltransferase
VELKPAVSFIITSWNSLPQLKNCLSSIESLCEEDSFPSHEVIVADGGSTDGTYEYLESVSDERTNVLGLKTLHCPNYGWPYSANKGLEEAEGEWVALSNPDIIFTQDFLALWRFAQRSAYGVFSVGLRDTHRTEYRANRRVTFPRMIFIWTRFGKWVDKTFLRRYFVRSFHYDSKVPIFVDHPLSSFILLRRDVIEKIGFLSTKYFLYLADSDYANRLNEAHIPIVHMPNLIFLHEASYSTKLRQFGKFDRLLVDGMIQYARDWSHVSALYAALLLDKGFSRMVKSTQGSSQARL